MWMYEWFDLMWEEIFWPDDIFRLQRHGNMNKWLQVVLVGLLLVGTVAAQLPVKETHDEVDVIQGEVFQAMP